MRPEHLEVLSDEMVAGLFGVDSFHEDAEIEDCNEMSEERNIIPKARRER